MTLRILLVSVESPPSFNAEALQVGKILEALRSESGVVVDEVTAASTSGVFCAVSSFATQQPNFHKSQTVTVPCRFSRWQRILIRLLAPWLPHRPDWSFLFSWRWRQAASQLQHAPDLIYSRSFPPSSTLAAAKLARHFRVPWFLHLSDPWTESSIKSSNYRTNWHLRQERHCLQFADRISFTSPTTLDRYQQLYPSLRDRMTLDPNCYDNTYLQVAAWKPQKRLRLVHTGSFTLGRWPDALFEALFSLPKDHPFLVDLELIHVGPVDSHTRRIFEQAGPWLSDYGAVSSPVAFQLQCSADLLLVVDYQLGTARDAQYLPSKLSDYLAIRRPVLAITDVGSASWQFVLENHLGTPAAHGDSIGLLQILFKYWQAWQRSDHTLFSLPIPSNSFSSHCVSRKIVAAAKQITGS